MEVNANLGCMTRLSVNVNKVAVLRNSRGGLEPDVCRAAEVAIDAGCAGITVHPRPDARHIRFEDVLTLRATISDRVEFNIEGNPFAAPRAGYPGLLAIAERVRPEQVTLVPDSDAQLTSDHGFDPVRDGEALAPIVAAYKRLGARVSIFVDSGVGGLEHARALGVDRVELYTGPYAAGHAAGRVPDALKPYVDMAYAAERAGLGVNAGHDLSQLNLREFLTAVPNVAEVSIGHALFSEALYDGLAFTVQRYLLLIAASRAGSGAR